MEMILLRDKFLAKHFEVVRELPEEIVYRLKQNVED